MGVSTVIHCTLSGVTRRNFCNPTSHTRPTLTEIPPVFTAETETPPLRFVCTLMHDIIHILYVIQPLYPSGWSLPRYAARHPCRCRGCMP